MTGGRAPRDVGHWGGGGSGAYTGFAMSSARSSSPTPSRRPSHGAEAPRIFIIDERESVRRALADRLGQTASVAVVGDSGDASRAVQAVHEGGVDVVLVEIKRGDGLGLELVRQSSASSPALRVIVLTSYPTDWEEAAAKRAGASAYLLKDLNTEELLRHILAGNNQ